MFVDSHCHLEGPKYDGDRAGVLARAYDAGIEAILAIGNGNTPYEADCGIRLAEEFDPQLSGTGSGERGTGKGERGTGVRIYASVGVHPHEAKLADKAALAHVEHLAKHPRVIAWGEIGLDYWYDFSPREVQRAVFVRQMELAGAARKPIIIHCRDPKDGRDAWNDTLRMLKLNWASSGLGGIMHCFSGTVDDMRSALDLGFMISFAGNITFPKAEDIRAAAREVPLDRMLIETDSPYLGPVPHRGRRNEPAYVREVAQQIANVRGMRAEDIGTRTTDNFYRFFRMSK